MHQGIYSDLSSPDQYPDSVLSKCALTLRLVSAML